MTTENGHDAVDALIAHAARHRLGDPIDLVDVEIAIADLCKDPMGSTKLRRRLRERNDQEVCETLADWFIEVARQRDADARSAARPSEKVLSPFQAVSLGAIVTGAAFALAGSMTLGAASVLMVMGLALWVVSTAVRYRLSIREDAANAEAKQFRRLAQVADREKSEKSDPTT